MECVFVSKHEAGPMVARLLTATQAAAYLGDRSAVDPAMHLSTQLTGSERSLYINRMRTAAQHPDKRSYRINELMPITGMSRSSIFRLIAKGKIKTRKCEGTTLVMREDLDAFYDSLMQPS